MLNPGQVCAASSRTYVQEGITEQFTEALKARFEGLVDAMGDPSNESTFLGPLADRAQFERVMDFLEIGKQDSKILTGGGRHGDRGNFIEPTIFVEPAASSKIFTDEIFGAVLVLKTFRLRRKQLRWRTRQTMASLLIFILTTSPGHYASQQRCRLGRFTSTATLESYLTRLLEGGRRVETVRVKVAGQALWLICKRRVC